MESTKYVIQSWSSFPKGEWRDHDEFADEDSARTVYYQFRETIGKVIKLRLVMRAETELGD